jgi:hypothetical protein
LIVRHFDSQLPASLVSPFVSLTSAAQTWLADRPYLDRLVRVVQPVEVGTDFIARPHFTYYTATDTYELNDDEESPEPPPELAKMRAEFLSQCGGPAGSLEAIIETVLARSLIEPTGKTFFHEGEARFIVVELKPTRNELERWEALLTEKNISCS